MSETDSIGRHPTPPAGGGGAEPVPWQLRMFSKTLKKRQKLDLLMRQIGRSTDGRCVMISHGDNNGALNYHLRAIGGAWTWVEHEAENIAEMGRLLGEEVRLGQPSAIPVEDASAELVVSVDVHEHLDDCRPFNRELSRITRPGGRVIVTTPNGNPWKPVTVLKNLIGMTKERYGHKVIGYTIRQHEAMLREVGLEPVAAGSYSRFFTEMLELLINFAYVMVLSKKGGVPVGKGTIAPSSQRQLRAVEKQYRLYALAYPFLHAVSRLDALLFMFCGYAVSVVARKPS